MLSGPASLIGSSDPAPAERGRFGCKANATSVAATTQKTNLPRRGLLVSRLATPPSSFDPDLDRVYLTLRIDFFLADKRSHCSANILQADLFANRCNFYDVER